MTLGIIGSFDSCFNKAFSVFVLCHPLLSLVFRIIINSRNYLKFLLFYYFSVILGVFEFDAFAKGTFGIASTLAELTGKGCITIIGGGGKYASN